jgi:hypothetical protein
MLQRRIQWHRVGWLLPLAVAAVWTAATSTPTVIAAAREHQVRAYLEAPPARPAEWRAAQPQPVRFDALMFRAEGQSSSSR